MGASGERKGEQVDRPGRAEGRGARGVGEGYCSSSPSSSSMIEGSFFIRLPLLSLSI